MFYNYIYLDPRKPGKYSYKNLNFSLLYEPFYVGKGKNKRYLDHLKEHNLSESTHKNNIINKIDNANLLKSFIVLFNHTDSELEAYDAEINIIKSIGLMNEKSGPLSNQSGGGLGGKGRKMTDAEKESRSINHWMKGKSYEEIYGLEKALAIKKQKSDSLKNNVCYSSKLRSKKISKSHKNKKNVFDIRDMSSVFVDLLEYKANKYLFNKKGKSKNEVHYYEIDGVFYKEREDVANILKCSISKVETLIRKETSKYNGHNISVIKDPNQILALVLSI